MAIADLDQDGWPDLILAGPGLQCSLHNRRGAFEKWNVTGDLPDATATFTAALVLDADNDGRLDLALAGASVSRSSRSRRRVSFSAPPRAP